MCLRCVCACVVCSVALFVPCLLVTCMFIPSLALMANSRIHVARLCLQNNFAFGGRTFRARTIDDSVCTRAGRLADSGYRTFYVTSALRYTCVCLGCGSFSRFGYRTHSLIRNHNSGLRAGRSAVPAVERLQPTLRNGGP